MDLPAAFFYAQRPAHVHKQPSIKGDHGMMKALRFLTVSVVGIGVLCGSALSAAPAANIKVGAAMNLTAQVNS